MQTCGPARHAFPPHSKPHNHPHFSFFPITSSQPPHMSSPSVPSTDDNVVYGLNYPPDFLPSLPVLLPRPTPPTPIRALTASQFATIHHAATISHAPDHV